MGKRLRIIVAEDQPLARCSTAFLLDTHDGLHVIGEAQDGHEAVDLARLHRPDVMVLDFQMPGSGAAAIAKMREFVPEMRVIVFSANDSDAVIDAVLKAGATAFVSKNTKIDPLIKAIEEACDGRRREATV